MRLFLPRNDGVLWAASSCLALSVHVAVAIFLIAQNAEQEGYYAPPAALMFSFSDEPTRPDIVQDTDIMAQPSNAQPEPKNIEEEKIENQAEIKAADIKSNFVINQKVEPKKKFFTKKLKTNDKQRPHQPKPLAQKSEKVRQIDARVSSQFSGAQTSLYEQSTGNKEPDWIAKVQSHLERQKNYLIKRYNDSSSGTVHVSFQVDQNGTIFAMKVAKSSGVDQLDQLAIDVLKRSSPLPKPPLGRADRPIMVPLVFRHNSHWFNDEKTGDEGR